MNYKSQPQNFTTQCDQYRDLCVDLFALDPWSAWNKSLTRDVTVTGHTVRIVIVNPQVKSHDPTALYTVIVAVNKYINDFSLPEQRTVSFLFWKQSRVASIHCCIYIFRGS